MADPVTPGRVIAVTGSPGSGKSSVARILAETSPAPRTAHLHSDDFYNYLRKGRFLPWLPEAHAQNTTVIEALVAASFAYARGGYEVIFDGILGPWFLGPFRGRAAVDAIDFHYVVLRPDRAEAIARVVARDGEAQTDVAAIGGLWDQFADLGELEGHVVATDGMTPDETVALVRDGIESGRFRLE
jgi:predicted kinase